MSIYIFELSGEDGETLRSGTFTGLFDRFFFSIFLFGDSNGEPMGVQIEKP